MRRLIGLLFFSSILLAQEDETIDPPTSFAREILQPLGMPVVAVYHEIKESPFLNMSRSEASGLEAIGDFFLTPSRYLFGGKTVNVKSGQCEKRCSFDYNNLDWLKTSFSLITLPICELLGCTLKGAALLSKETREHYKVIYDTMEAVQPVSYLEDYKKQGVENFHSDEVSISQKLARPSTLPEKHLIELQAFKQVAELFDKHGIIYWLDCGSSLGAFRYGGMIPWDDDIDISILSADHENVKRLLNTLDPEEFQTQDWSSYRYPGTFIKLYIKKTKTLIDIYHYNLHAETKTATYFYTYKDSAIPEKWKKFELVMTKPIPYEVMFPLKKANFDGIQTWVPNQLEAFLHFKYGENLTPTMLWDEVTQSYRKVKDHPYWSLFK